MSEWSKWFEHDGVGCPVPAGTYLHAVSKGGEEAFGFLQSCDLSHFHWDLVTAAYGTDIRGIARYRIRKPRGLEILEGILSEIDTPVREVTV